MNSEMLLKYFGRISEAPDAVPRLRRFILDLAVRGKLVEQEPTDESAVELLKQIQAKKVRLVKEGVIRRLKVLPPARNDELSFALPTQWVRVRLGSVIELVSGQHLQPPEYSTDESSGIPYITGPSDFGPDGLVISRYALVRKAVAHKGQLLLTVKGAGVGKTTTCDLPEVAISRQLMAMTAIGWNGGFLLLVTHLLAISLKESARSLIPGISREDVEAFVFSLPPLAEQDRIVAKVEKLMALCDQLEEARTEREGRRDRLVVASLHHIHTGTTTAKQARFHLDHLPRLTSRPEHIRKLREAIINLAVLGHLIPQASHDEPAEKMLRRISKARICRRELMTLDPTELTSPLPDLPKNWIWTVIDQIAEDDDNAITDGPFGANLKTEHYVIEPGYRVIRLQNIGHGYLRGEHRTYINKSRFEGLPKHHVFPGDLVVAGLVDPTVRCCELPGDIGPALVKADCYRLSVHPQVSPRFVMRYLNSQICQGFASAHHHGMTLTRIGLGNFRRIPIPLPPPAEQHRIVAKVDELMALCDQLEAQLATTEADSRRLLEVVLSNALASG